MESAQLGAAASDPHQELRANPAADDETRISLADKLVMICFVIGIALFGSITVVDLVTSFFR